MGDIGCGFVSYIDRRARLSPDLRASLGPTTLVPFGYWSTMGSLWRVPCGAAQAVLQGPFDDSTASATHAGRLATIHARMCVVCTAATGRLARTHVVGMAHLGMTLESRCKTSSSLPWRSAWGQVVWRREMLSNSNSLLKLTWQIYSFAKSQNQMPSEKIGLLQQIAIWACQKNLAS